MVRTCENNREKRKRYTKINNSRDSTEHQQQEKGRKEFRLDRSDISKLSRSTNALANGNSHLHILASKLNATNFLHFFSLSVVCVFSQSSRLWV